MHPAIGLPPLRLGIKTRLGINLKTRLGITPSRVRLATGDNRFLPLAAQFLPTEINRLTCGLHRADLKIRKGEVDMNKITFATAAAAGLSAAIVGLAAPAAAAPSGSDAQATISQLEADGNRVIVNRLSSAPLSQAEVVAVRPGPALRGTVPNAGYNDDNRQGVVTGQVYYVDVR